MENTIENKERLFALYYRQPVMRYEFFEDSEEDENVDMNFAKASTFLKLKPLSQISDEDAIKVCKILGVPYFKDKTYGFDDFFISNETIETYLSDDSVEFTLYVFDYLRTKGYALPFMNLSVKQQIAYGWVKLKKD